MNILYITNHLNIGGITSYVLTLASGLKARGHQVYVASSGAGLTSRFIERDITFIPIPIKTKAEISPKILVSMFKLSRFVKEKQIEILHSHSRTTQILGCLLEKKTGIAHISTCHGFFKRRPLRKIFPCWGRRVIAISEQVKEHLRNDFKLEEDKIRVINNGIDIEKFKMQNAKSKMEFKNKLGLGDNPAVGIVARLSDVKGHIYLIQAMKNVLASIPQAQLLIVGEGKMQEELLNLTKTLKIERNVCFIREVSDTREVLWAMDLFVMPSLKEGLGLALMEAMAAGLPVIGSQVGGIRSLIQDGYNGLLVEPADSSALSKAILELLQNPAKRELLGNNAQNFISQNFSQEKMILQTEEVYKECVYLKN